jgi:hypothetical protein
MTEEREYSVHFRTPHEKQAEFLNSHAKRIVIRAGRHEGVARQIREEGRIALLKGFVRQFLGIAGTNSKATRRQVGSCGPCAVHGASREGMLAFVSRHVYLSPLDVGVRSSSVG